MRGAEVVAQHDRAPRLDHLGDEHRVAERFRHLLAAHGDPGVVHPVPGELVAVRLGLGDLVLVVREDQVQAAAVDVEDGAQVLVRHRRALQVPAGAAAAPRGLPAGLAGLGRLPHGEVAGVPLAGLAVAGGLEQVVQLLVGQAQVLRERLHVEVDVAVGLVGVAALDEAAHHLDHLGDMAGRARFVRRRQATEDGVAVVERALVLVPDRPPGAALVGRLGDDLVVDVGDVADERDLVAAVGEPAAHDVEVQARADVPDMRCGLHGGTTQVDRDTTRLERGEVTNLPGTGVVQANSHESRVVGPG